MSRGGAVAVNINKLHHFARKCLFSAWISSDAISSFHFASGAFQAIIVVGPRKLVSQPWPEWFSQDLVSSCARGRHRSFGILSVSILVDSSFP